MSAQEWVIMTHLYGGYRHVLPPRCNHAAAVISLSAGCRRGDSFPRSVPL
jgi:hypothetical protein